MVRKVYQNGEQAPVGRCLMMIPCGSIMRVIAVQMTEDELLFNLGDAKARDNL